MITSPEQVVSQVLEPDERLIWSGTPDVEVMTKTMGGRKRRLHWTALIAVVVLIAGLMYTAPQTSGMLQSPLGSTWIIGAGLALATLLLGRLYYSTISKRYARSLVYGITDQRLLILENGKLELEFSPARVKWVERRERFGAPGLSDLIWEEHLVHRSGTSRITNPVQIESAKIGFKAQPGGEDLLQRIESWRQGHLEETVREAGDFVESRQETGRKKSATGGKRIKSPVLGFSIEAPEEWKAEVRRKKLEFGKTGVDWTANKWSTPEKSTDWNVIRLKNAVDTTVEVQVHETEPFNTLEAMANPRLPKSILKNMQLVDQEPEFALNGLEGFYLTRLLQGKGESEMVVGQTSNLAEWYQRQHVLHDGQRQYYILSMWPKEAPEQGEICQTIVSTLQAS